MSMDRSRDFALYTHPHLIILQRLHGFLSQFLALAVFGTEQGKEVLAGGFYAGGCSCLLDALPYLGIDFGSLGRDYDLVECLTGGNLIPDSNK